MQRFHYRVKVVKHLQLAGNPCINILQRNMPLTRSQVDLLDEEDLIRCKYLKSIGCVKTYSEVPVVCAFGPFNDYR